MRNFIFLLLLIGCKDKSDKYPLPPLSLKLEFEAMELIQHIDNKDSCLKAISLLDSATDIDKDYFPAYYNKLPFLCSIGDYRRAIMAIDNASRIKPEAHDLYLISGILHRKLKDTTEANHLFLKSLSICNGTLDTMPSTNNDYMKLQSNRILLNIMLNEKKKAKYLLDKLKDIAMDSATSNQFVHVVNEHRDSIISKMLEPKNYRR